MKVPSHPPSEDQRLSALQAYGVLDTPPEAAFDGLTKALAFILDVPISLVSLVDANRQWFKSRYGLAEAETPRDISFCGHVVELDTLLIVEDTHRDSRFQDNPLVTGHPQIRFYVGYPLRTPEGHVLGTLCAIDHRPRTLGEKELQILEILAHEVIAQLELRRKNRLLQEEQLRLRTLLEAAVDPIVTIDERGIIQGTNTATSNLFGYAASELLNQNISILMDSPVAAEHDGYIQRYLSTGERRVVGTGREVQVRCKDGSFIPCELSLGEMQMNGGRVFTGILRDISERKRAEAKQAEAVAELERTHNDLRRVLNQLRIGTVMVDSAGRVTFASRTSSIDSGMVLEGLGKAWEDVLPLGESSRRAIRALLRQPEESRQRIELSMGLGTDKRWVELEIRDDPRDSAAHIFFLYDISDLRCLRERLTTERYGRMVGDSPAMREVYATIQQVARGSWTVLIEGETGTGKELVAQAIHQASPRRGAPFIAANCAGLTESLLGSQLFGHVKGAFTGAVTDREGLFEAASGGTLFLDEIGDVSLQVQSSLLRVLQEREVTRLGENRPRKVDVRIIAATNRNLQLRVRDGLFRDDLLYRIRNTRIHVPPLRDRRGDIPLLVASFLAEEKVTAGKLVSEVSPEAMRRLSKFDWPGNVRELRGAIEFAVVRCRGSRIEIDDLPAEVLDGADSQPIFIGKPVESERDRILSTLRRTGGNRARTARVLGMGRATLYRRLEELAITDREIDEGSGR